MVPFGLTVILETGYIESKLPSNDSYTGCLKSKLPNNNSYTCNCIIKEMFQLNYVTTPITSW